MNIEDEELLAQLKSRDGDEESEKIETNIGLTLEIPQTYKELIVMLWETDE